MNIDLLSPGSFADGQPHDQFRWLRDNEPVHWHPEPDGPGFWAVTTHDLVKEVGRTPEVYSSSPTIMIDDGAIALMQSDFQMMLTMDPPRHATYRHLVVPDFIPRAVRDMQPRIRYLASKIIDRVADDGACDLVTDMAGLMPSYVIAEMLGIPLEDGCALYDLTETIHAAPESVAPGAAMGAILEMFTYARGVFEDKAAHPGDDLATKLVQSTVDGKPLDPIDFNLFFMLLVDAGGDTTRNLVGGGMHALFEHPEERARLCADLDGRLPGAIEEMLRWVSPVVYMRRTVTRATSLGGVTIAGGDKVVMYYGAANRDPSAFADPDRFDVGRSPNDHVAFGGGGPHFCLGSHLARMEIDAMLREILTRLPGIEPTGPTEWLASNFISGPKHLPVRFSPTGAGG